MPYLGDYLGQLLSEITIARMHADLEAMRVAELYASNTLLRNMPVPRFRLPAIEMDVPVVIKQMEEPREGESPRGIPGLTDMRKAFDNVLEKHLSRENIKLTSKQKNILKSALNKKEATLFKPREVAIDINHTADELANATYTTLSLFGPLFAAESRQQLEETLKKETRIEFLKLLKRPPRLQALITTAEIREAGPNDVVTRLHIKVTEEAMEWTTIESDDRKQDKLVLE